MGHRQMKKLALIAFSILLLVPMGAQNVFADTFLTSSINADTTFTLAGSPYRIQITEIISVAPGVTLTIDPGVTLIVEAGGEFRPLSLSNVQLDGLLVLDEGSPGGTLNNDGNIFGIGEIEECGDLNNNLGTISVNIIPCSAGAPVGSISIPIDSASMLVANTQSFSWMIPVVLSVLGIGLFAVTRKSENS